MKQLVALVMIAFLVPATATVAFAKNPCKEEKDKFCKDAKAAGKKLRDCLKEHSAELSPACKEFVDKPKEPKSDAEKAAKKAKKGKGKTSQQATSRQRRSPRISLPKGLRPPLPTRQHRAAQRPSRNDYSRRAA